MKKSGFFLLLLFICSCSLSADQEASLHTAMVSYINARNEGIATAYVAYTHPNAVAYYQELGDSTFKFRFSLNDVSSQAFLQDGTIREIESKGNKIHVLYTFTGVFLSEFDTYDSEQEMEILAISEDNGRSWFFIEKKDYLNDKILSPKDRLIN